MIRLAAILIALIASIATAAADTAAERKAFAGEFERTLLRRGMSVTVTAEGREATTLRIMWPAMSKAAAFNLSEAIQEGNRRHDRGFRTVIFTNDDGGLWRIDMRPN